MKSQEKMKFLFQNLTVSSITLLTLFSYSLNSYAADANETKRATWSFDHAKGFLDDAKRLIDQGKVDDAVKLIEKSVALIKVDPEPGIFLDGRITIDYDSSLLSLKEFGWFGEWGLDPTLPSPPLNIPPEGFEWFLQDPNSGLSVSIQNILPSPGSTISSLRIDYDGGDEGFMPSTGSEVNIFGARFEVLHEISFGEFKSAVTLPGNDLASQLDIDSLDPEDIASLPNYNRCIPPRFSKPTFCGVTTPEPTSNLGLIAFSTLGVILTLKRQIKSSKPSEKETTKVG